MYTRVYYLPPALNWVPNSLEVLELIQHFMPDSVEVVAYNKPFQWGVEDLPDPVYHSSRISPDEAITQFAQRRPVLTSFIINSQKWGERTERSQQAFPREVSDGWIVWDTTLHVGPEAVPEGEGERMAAETMCCLNISGDGIPPDPYRFLEFLRQTPEIIDLERFLRDLTGGKKEWSVFISWT